MEIHIGKVTHYFSHLSVAVLQLTGEINTGDLIHIVGNTTDLIQRVKSMEIDHHPVHSVEAGGEVAMKVAGHVRKGDIIFKIPSDEAEKVAMERSTFLDNDR